MYKRILFCSDLYPGSDYAFAAALELAEETGAELLVIHVLESRQRYSGHVITRDGEVWAGEKLLDRLRDRMAFYYLERVDQKMRDRVRFIARAGIPWTEILRIARREKADLIVMGSYTVRISRPGPPDPKNHLGENTQKVTLSARCPVSIITSPRQRLIQKTD